jgi:PadR family transcriptional regulator PadR
MLQTMGPQHGFGLAKRIRQISEGALSLNQGTLLPGPSAPRAKAMDSVQIGRLQQVERESVDWTRAVAIMQRFLKNPD